MLIKYIDECLSSSEKFDGNGYVLQDLINEIGKRLGYSVIHGRFKGKKGENGFDGLWTAPDGSSIVMESKTTDIYSISLDTIANYRQQLI
ncbi:hypothetical protein [Kineothrix alysoides]|uniref:hypothetical protein n=1 Tax=Kineothrix alysoides TaxID=1469948 RepID=UPI0010481BD0|nr:hypothetical protein [Kineothrix alysoides]